MAHSDFIGVKFGNCYGDRHAEKLGVDYVFVGDLLPYPKLSVQIAEDKNGQPVWKDINLLGTNRVVEDILKLDFADVNGDGKQDIQMKYTLIVKGGETKTFDRTIFNDEIVKQVTEQLAAPAQ